MYDLGSFDLDFSMSKIARKINNVDMIFHLKSDKHTANNGAITIKYVCQQLLTAKRFWLRTGGFDLHNQLKHLYMALIIKFDKNWLNNS